LLEAPAAEESHLVVCPVSVKTMSHDALRIEWISLCRFATQVPPPSRMHNALLSLNGPLGPLCCQAQHVATLMGGERFATWAASPFRCVEVALPRPFEPGLAIHNP
jgi:hypothetical protein